MTAEHECEQQGVGDQALPQHDAHAALGWHGPQRAHHEWHVAEGVDHKDQQDGRGKEIGLHRWRRPVMDRAQVYRRNIAGRRTLVLSLRYMKCRRAR